MKITFLGTGTSQGVPVPGCRCEVCNHGNEKDKRLRTSALVETGGNTFSIDAGPDFRYQMLRAGVKTLDAILITHSHRDHIAGLDDVRAYNYLSRKPMDVYATNYDQKEIKREFSYAFNNDYPGLPQYNLIEIDESPFKVRNIDVIPVPALHYNTKVLGFRIGNFGYITDTNYIPPHSLQLLDGLEVLVINALRREKHVSHYNLEEALKVVRFLSPEKAYLTHISHLMGFHKDLQHELPENVWAAYDGMVLVL